MDVNERLLSSSEDDEEKLESVIWSQLEASKKHIRRRKKLTCKYYNVLNTFNTLSCLLLQTTIYQVTVTKNVDIIYSCSDFFIKIMNKRIC